jgi:transcription elongation factor Elf1
MLASEVNDAMNQFVCPECARHHSEPVDGTFVIAVRCADCDLTFALEARRLSARKRADRAKLLAA